MKKQDTTSQEFYSRYTYNPDKDCIGQGGFGKVYRGRDIIRDRDVAIKVSVVGNNNSNIRLQNEVAMANNMPLHKNIAYYEKCYTLNTPIGVCDFAVMQYYKDGSLENLITHEKLTIEERYNILIQILRGIGFLHKHDIIHRDIKPQNILIARYNGEITPKITDFGISKHVDNINKSIVSNSIVGAGTIAYAAPEQLAERELKKNCDLWSFGVIAYRMLTGKLPFNYGNFSPTSEDGREELNRQKRSGVIPADINSIEEPWQQLIRACLVVDYKNRIQSAEEALSILGCTITDEGNSNKKQTKRSKGMKRNLVVITSILLLVCLCIGGWMLFNKEKEPAINEEAIINTGLELYETEQYEECVELILPLAQKGNAKAQYIIGMLYYLGNYYDEDNEEAVEWFKKAAEQDNYEAQYKLGLCYTNGYGVESNEDKANMWYSKSIENLTLLAEAGDSDKQYELALRYYNADGTDEDNEKALHWFKEAAANDNYMAMLHVGECYAKGYGTEQNEDKANRWYKRGINIVEDLAISDDVDAQYIMGVAHYEGEFGVDQDDETAFNWLTKAAEKEHAGALYYLAQCYMEERGTDKDFDYGIELMTRSAEGGDSDAQYYLGYYYKYTLSDSETAYDWFRTAAYQSHTNATTELAYYYFFGECVEEKNEDLAIALWELAASNGSEEAGWVLEYWQEGDIDSIIKLGTPQDEEEPDYSGSSDDWTDDGSLASGMLENKRTSRSE